MRTALIYLMIFVVVTKEIHGRPNSEEKKRICTPGSHSKIDCNSCTCSSDGTAWGCTKIGCIKKPVELPSPDASPRLPRQTGPSFQTQPTIMVCEPGSLRESTCKSCRCDPDGTGELCTRRCPRSVRDVHLRFEPNYKLTKIAM